MSALRTALFVLTFALTAGGVIFGALLLAETKGVGYGIALAVGVWLGLHLFRLGYDHDDGVDVRQRLLPGPLDWPVKFTSFLNFWTAPRPIFRAAYLGGGLALVVVGFLLLTNRSQ